MQEKIVKNEKGIALIITISVITVLMALALELNSNVRSEVISTAMTRDRLALKQMADSGIQIGIGIVLTDLQADSEDRKFFDSLQEDWADPEKINEVIAEFPFDDGSIELTITDELGKIQVNALVVYPDSREFNEEQKAIWEKILNYFVTDEDSFEFVGTTGIVGCIKDWLDTGDDDSITGINGAESDYYLDLDPPYKCKNGPIEHLDELVLVKGIDPENFYSVGEMFQLPKYVTVYGMSDSSKDNKINNDIKARKNGNSFTFEGKININTAELPVLSVLFEDEDENLAVDLIEYRDERTLDGAFKNPVDSENWYRNVSGIEKDTKIRAVTTKTDTFRIECTATINNTKIKADAVVRRYMDEKKHKPAYETLSYKMDA